MKIISGDLIKMGLTGDFDVIVHGCNCFHTMGGGIALTIKKVFPSAFQADKQTEYGDENKLGTYSDTIINNNGHYLVVLNAYTQYNYGGNGVNVNYDAIEKVFKQIAKDFNGLRIGYPKIGCGLAGGDWAIVSDIINKSLQYQNHTLVEFK